MLICEGPRSRLFLEESRPRFARRRNSFPLHAMQRKTPTTLVTGVRVNQWVCGFPLRPFEAPRSGLEPATQRL